MSVILRFKTFPGLKISMSKVTMVFPDPFKIHS